MFIIKIIDKLLAKKRCMIFNKKGRKTALLSYILIPSLNIPLGLSYYISHNGKMICQQMIKTLIELDYKIYLYNYLDTNIKIDIHYDLFIGHNINFHKIAKTINSAAKKVLLLLGTSPIFGNEQLEIRSNALFNRKNVRIEYSPFVTNYDYINFQVADYIFIMGNNFIKNTWPKQFHHKMISCNNITPFKTEKKKGRENNFIYAGSHNLLRRGLDLLLEIFPRRKETLYLFSSFKGEDKFIATYHDEVFKTPNIKTMGFINLASKQFKRIVDDVDFVIYPTSAEGQSTTVLYLMSLGALPVITENCGFDNIEKIGFKIERGDIESVGIAIDRAINSTKEEIDEKRNVLFEEMKKYTKEAFSNNFKGLIESLT